MPDLEASIPRIPRAVRIHEFIKRAKALRTRLEAANAELYQSVRSDIVRGGQPRVLLQWLAEFSEPERIAESHCQAWASTTGTSW